MLSYHCYNHNNNYYRGGGGGGLSCIGILVDNSHVAFHAKPVSGVLLMDLFTSSQKGSIMITSIQNIFGIDPAATSNTSTNTAKDADECQQVPCPSPRMVWSQKKRGFGHHGIKEQQQQQQPTSNDDASCSRYNKSAPMGIGEEISSSSLDYVRNLVPGSEIST